VQVDGHVIPVLLLVNINVHGDIWAIFFNDPRTFFFYYYLRRRRWGGCICGGGSYRCRRLLTTSDPE
jgi:hypothetical protein